MKLKNLIAVSAIMLVLLSGCGKKENMIQEHYKNEINLFGTYNIEFDFYLENVNYSKETAALIKKLIYDNKSFKKYIKDAEDEFIGPVSSDDFPPLEDDDGNNYFYKSYLNESFNILHHDKTFVVFENNKYYYHSGAAHGYYSINYKIIDIAQGKILDVGDLISPISDDYLAQLIEKEYGINSFLRDNLWPPDTVNINAKNIELLWNTYTITPYSAGVIGLILQDEDHLTDKGKELKAKRAAY